MKIDTLFESDEFDFPEISEREMACERLRFNITEDILLAMQDSGTSKADLAKKLGKSKAHISQLLDGGRNMTLKTLSDIAYALNSEVKVAIYRDGIDVSHQLVPERNWSKNAGLLKNEPKRILLFTIDTHETNKINYDFG